MNVYLLILVLFWALYGFQIFAFWGIGDNKQSFFFFGMACSSFGAYFILSVTVERGRNFKVYKLNLFKSFLFFNLLLVR